VEESKGLNVRELEPFTIALEEVFKIKLNFEIESALLRPMIIIVARPCYRRKLAFLV
jgi:hypothetical protein